MSRPLVWDGCAAKLKVNSGEWRVVSDLIDTLSIFSILARSFNKAQPGHQPLACSRNPPLTTLHSSLSTHLKHPCFIPYEPPPRMGWLCGQVKSEKWIVDSDLIDTLSIFSILARSFNKAQPGHQPLACSRNPPLTTLHSSLSTHLKHPCFIPYEPPPRMGWLCGQVKSEKWIVDSDLIDTLSIFSILARSFNKAQPGHQPLACSRNPPLTTLHSSLTLHSSETPLFHPSRPLVWDGCAAR